MTKQKIIKKAEREINTILSSYYGDYATQILSLKFGSYTLEDLIVMAEKIREGTNAIDYLHGFEDGYDKAIIEELEEEGRELNMTEL